MRIAAVGPGAIGLAFAAAAAQARHDLVVCGRRPLPRMVVTLDAGPPVTIDAPLVTDPAALPDGPADLVLLAVKAHQTAGAAAWLERLCGPDTVVAVLQNGVQQRALVAPFAPAVAAEAILPVVVWCPATVEAPGAVRVRSEARLVSARGPAGDRLAAALAPSFAVVRLVDDLDVELWRKLTLNAVAGLMAVSAPTAAIYARADVQAVAQAMARECVAVARAVGVALDDAVAEQIVAQLTAMPAGATTSIAVDRARGAALEWEARNAVVNRLGALNGVPTPVSDIVTALLAAASEAGAADAAARDGR